MTQAVWYVPLVSVSGALFVSVVNFFAQRWRYKLDRLSQAVDLICLEINQASMLSVDYWTSSDANPALEARLLGKQLLVQQLMLAIHDQDKKLKLREAEGSILDLFDAMTGGAFQVSDRVADPGAAQKVQSAAARMNGLLRTALVNRGRALW